ncbi:hypothetical protein [Litchfieldella xinjiangensis]|uniref:hypothetical protein n=1 Tax=Litchfieldella xinjiangensis TaxID=1166948 RepID=UPI0005B9EB90|nr:hypothetical protein [Halomonas xinjiangensis]
MIEVCQFSAKSWSGEPATLVAFVHFAPDNPPESEATYVLGPIELFTLDGRTVDYVDGQLVSLEDDDTFIPSDTSIIDLLEMEH